MAKDKEQAKKSFETFREWVKDMGMNPTCIWCPKAASAYFYSKHADAQVLINTTPAGMYPNTDGCAVDLDKLPNLTGVIVK